MPTLGQRCHTIWEFNWPSILEKKRKIDFQDGGHESRLGFQIGTILANSDLQVTPMLPIKLKVNWPFYSGEKLNWILKIGGKGAILDFRSNQF